MNRGSPVFGPRVSRTSDTETPTHARRTRNPAALEFLLASLMAGWFALMLTFGGNI